jgi:DNA mismatch repair protein MutS
MSRENATPLMQQYQEIKKRHQNAILLFRMGDFYEMFYDDAKIAARTLGLTLTSRNNGGAAAVPLAGVPVRAVGEYLRRLVQHGFRVSICEQVEDPKLAKGIVRREVVETITPGAAFADDLLDGARNNFLCALHTIGDVAGIAAVDVSTGEFRLSATQRRDARTVLARLTPRELIVPAGESEAASLAQGLEALLTQREKWEFETGRAERTLTEHFGVLSLEGFGVTAEDAAAVGAAGALFRYLRELQPGGVPQLAPPVMDRPGGIMPLDEMTRRNLEIVDSLRGDSTGTLLGVLDRTQTPMGARTLRRWLLAPLTDAVAINARLDAVGALTSDSAARTALRTALGFVRDVERLAAKAAAGRAGPRDLRALGDSLAQLPGVGATLGRAMNAGMLAAIAGSWDDCADLATEIRRTLTERPPSSIGDESADTIAAGVERELDELRTIASGGKDAIVALQARERERTGITSLKVGYNRVFGYFIEVTNANARLVPPDYQRRQTLTGAERYVTPALKEFEEKVLHATERIELLERRIFDALRARTGSEIGRLQRVSGALALLDVLAALAEAASREGYVRPVVEEGFDLDITAGRHPVVERMMPRDQFIPNDVRLSPDARMVILTGPNMAGKSTILRQIGLIVLMAQAGSFVPASRARIGITDRVFTRVGASDNLVRGQSTFMVEMSETSAILHTATARSLVLLDEIGRGTSTWDGVSIAWAVSEHLHESVRCKTVFATHYHELTQLADEFTSVRNYNVEVRESGERILFLHRLQPGGADRSYGIEVGRLAGLPKPVIARARVLLELLEREQLATSLRGKADTSATERAGQLALFASAEPHPVIERLRHVDTNTMTPIAALALLAQLAAEVQDAQDGVARPETRA